MHAELKFLNDIAKPWDELNELLAGRYAVQPELSTITARATALSHSIRHQVDVLAVERGLRKRLERQNLQNDINAECPAVQLITDVSDSSKHIQLDRESRHSTLFVAAMFEVNQANHLRFLRNGVFVEHASLGRQDFMHQALLAIEYWEKKRSLKTDWKRTIREESADFTPEEVLHFDPKYCIRMSSTRCLFFRRDPTGLLRPCDVRIEVG